MEHNNRMDNLNNSTFFDDRLIQYIQKLLVSAQKITPINNNETMLMNRRDELRELNSDLNGELIRNLTEVKSYLKVNDVTLFLLEARRMGMISEALEALDYIVREERMLNYNQLKELLDNAYDVPLSWGIVLLGEDIDDRYEKKQTTVKSGLDMDRLRNFK